MGGFNRSSIILLNIIAIISSKHIEHGIGYIRNKKSPYPTSQLHTDQTNNKLYLYEKTNTTNLIMLGISLDAIPNSFYHITAHKPVWFMNNEKKFSLVSLDMDCESYNPVLQKYIIYEITNIIFKT